jgi:hypothetical protein
VGATRSLFVLSLVACGRLHFDPQGTAGDGRGGGDGTGTADGAADSRLIAWYTFDDGIAGRVTKDMTGHGYDAVCVSGASCPSTTAGHAGLAMSGCSPSAPGLEVSDAPALRVAAPFTLAAWARWTDTAGLASIIAKPVGAATGDSFQIDIDQNGILRFTIGDANNFARLAATAPLILAQWVHVAGTYDGSMMHIYAAGVEFAAPIAGSAMAYDTQALVLGSDRNSGASAEDFSGAIDDVRIYSVALSASEISALAAM